MRDHGGLIVDDEVTTGLGRTGKWLGIEHNDVQPDIVVFGKALGNGYPVSAVVMRREIAARAEGTGLRYVQSHQNDPLGCAVAREVLTVLESDRLIERSARVGAYMRECLTQLSALCPGVTDVRGTGLMLAVDLRSDDGRGPSRIERVVGQMLSRGFVIGAKPEFSLLRFMPAFTMPTEEIDRMCANLEIVLTEIFDD
jgi:acetylornithine aminotransferase